MSKGTFDNFFLTKKFHGWRIPPQWNGFHYPSSKEDFLILCSVRRENILDESILSYLAKIKNFTQNNEEFQLPFSLFCRRKNELHSFPKETKKFLAPRGLESPFPSSQRHLISSHQFYISIQKAPSQHTSGDKYLKGTFRTEKWMIDFLTHYSIFRPLFLFCWRRKNCEGISRSLFGWSALYIT